MASAWSNPMEDEAMQFLEHGREQIFSLAFTWLLGRPIKDTFAAPRYFRGRLSNLEANRAFSATSIRSRFRPAL